MRAMQKGAEFVKPLGPPHERESILLWNDTDEPATLWTASATYYRRMIKRGFTPKQEDTHSALFEFPKKSVKLPRFGKSNRGAHLRKKAEVDK